MDFFIKVLRTLFWLIASVAAWITDNLYIIALQIARLNIFEIKIRNQVIIWRLWQATVFFTMIAIVVRIVVILIKVQINPEKMIAKFNLGKKMLYVILTVFFLYAFPVITNAIGKTANTLMNNISYVIGYEDDVLPSTLIATAINYKNDPNFDPTRDSLKFVDVFDINKKENGKFIFFEKLEDLVILLIAIGFSAYILFSITLDISKRVYELLAMILIGFIPISAIIEEDDSVGRWVKGIVGIFISNFVEVYFTLTTFLFTGYLGSVGLNLFAQLFLIFGGLLVALNGSQLVARFVGVETNGNTLQQLSQLSQVNAGIGRNAMAATALAGSTIAGVTNIVGRGGVKAGRGIMQSLGGVGVADYGKVTDTYSTSGSANASDIRTADYQAMNRNDTFAKAFSQPQSTSHSYPGTSNDSSNSRYGIDTSRYEGLNTNSSDEFHTTNNGVSKTSTYTSTPLYRKGSWLEQKNNQWYEEGGVKRAFASSLDRIYENSLKRKQARIR